MAARPSWLKTTLVTLGLGVLLGWASVFLIQPLIHAGVHERTANRLPFLGFFLGLALGLASAVSRTTKSALSYAVLVPVTGGVFWFFGVVLGGLLVGFGVAPSIADYAPILGFCLGICAVLLPGLVIGSEAARAFFSRAERRQRRRSPR